MHDYATEGASVVTPAPRAQWSSVLRSDPDATAQQSPGYFEAVLDVSGGRDASAMFTRGDGRRIVVPLVRHPAIPRLGGLSGYPARMGYAGALACGGLRVDDARTVLGYVSAMRTPVVAIGGTHRTAEKWRRAAAFRGNVTARTVYVIDLRPGWGHYFDKAVDKDIRRCVRKAQRRGVEVTTEAGPAAVEEFYGIYLRWAKDMARRSVLPAPVSLRAALHREPFAKFAAVANRTGPECRIHIARHEGVAVAGCITLLQGNNAIGWRSYSVKDLANPVAANIAAQVHGVADAVEYGCQYFDLGQSIDNPGLKAFKRSMGGAEAAACDVAIETPVYAAARRTASIARQAAMQGLAAVAAARGR